MWQESIVESLTSSVMAAFMAYVSERCPVTEGHDPDDILTFNRPAELLTYMQNRMIELGFDTAVSNALCDMYKAMEEQESMYSWLL